MITLKELDTVALLSDIPAHHLEKGDVGAVVHVLDDQTVEVEFVDEEGKTKALLPLSKTDLIRLNLTLIPT